MRFRTWLDGWKSSAPKWRPRLKQACHTRPRPTRHKLYLEQLEERAVPAFLTPVNYPVGSNPQDMVSADFTNDGLQDLAVVNYNDSTVSVLVGDATVAGTFDPAVTSAAGYGPLSLAVGDFDGDGLLDVATANLYDVSVMLGNGDGTFQAPSSMGVIGNPQSVAVGDFDGDGLLDLGVTSNLYFYDGYGYWGTYYHYESYANVLLGNGDALGNPDGTFSGPNSTYLGYGYNTSAAVAADLNGDIYDDFATANFDYGTLSVLLGDSSGFLQGPSDYYTGNSFALAAEDLDGDGDNDLVTANFYGNDVSVLMGDGAGSFVGPTNYATGNYPISIALGDFTGDGKPDVATTSYYANQLAVLYGGGDGTFSSPVHSAVGANPRAMAADDFNGDGWLDAATANLGDSNVSVLINDQYWPAPPPPSVSINDPAAVLESSTGSVTFTLTLSFAYGTPITVHYETADGSATTGSDYTGASGDVTFAAGQTSYVITVALLDDRLAEPTESFVVNLTTTEAFIGDGQGVGRILDNEPRISIGDAIPVVEGNTGSFPATFTLTLSAVYDVDVTVHYDTANGSAAAGSDYTGTSGDVTIPAGFTTQTFTVAVLGDRLAESTETFNVNLSAPVNAGISDGQGVGSILDNEPRISINNVSKKEGNGKTTLFVFTVTLSAAYDQAVTVNYATANGTATAGSDYQTKSATLTFAPGVTSMTITISVITDRAKEADETFFVNLSGASSNALINVAQGIGTILDDDSHGK